MKWFKHYNTASEGQSFELLISEKDFETAFVYWWILEQISKYEDTEKPESRGKVLLNYATFKRKLNLNSQRTDRVLLKIAKTFNLEIKRNLDQTIEVFAPKWLELQENRGGKRDAKKEQSFVKTPTEVRSKNKEIRTKRLDTEKEEFELDFESAYVLYKNKKGKTDGFKKLYKEIQTKEDLELLKKSIENYNLDISINKTEAKYIKHFSTFVNCWRDWLEYQPTGKLHFENSRKDIIDDFSLELKKIKES
jgi:hypothetical protein